MTTYRLTIEIMVPDTVGVERVKEVMGEVGTRTVKVLNEGYGLLEEQDYNGVVMLDVWVGGDPEMPTMH